MMKKKKKRTEVLTKLYCKVIQEHSYIFIFVDVAALFANISYRNKSFIKHNNVQYKQITVKTISFKYIYIF